MVYVLQQNKKKKFTLGSKNSLFSELFSGLFFLIIKVMKISLFKRLLFIICIF